MNFWDSLARRLLGYREDETHRESGTGTIPAGTSGERPRGTEPATDAGTSADARANVSPEPESVAREILAARGWYLRRDESARPFLTSFNGTRWDGPRLMADQVPSSTNTSGIYALTADNQYTATYKDQAAVWGTVALSGIVVEGERGYRGQQAVIRSLTVQQHPEEMRDTIMLEIVCALEDRYQCTVAMDEEALWLAVPDETLFPGIYYSATTQVVPYCSSAQSIYIPIQRRYR